VLVEVNGAGGQAVLSVVDQCGGIPPADIEQVFDLAYRGDAARTPGGTGGAGLGLAIVQGLVRAHAGEVVVTNEPGGCRFTVRLPMASLTS
jgi:signal transduction histidine kinase